jgi:hypothetical protein
MGGSIYPAVIYHGLLNPAASLNLTGSGSRRSAEGWLLLTPACCAGIVLIEVGAIATVWLKDDETNYLSQTQKGREESVATLSPSLLSSHIIVIGQ